MEWQKFNQRMNVIFIFKIEDISKRINELYSELQELAVSADKFKEEINRDLSNSSSDKSE